MSVAKNNPLPLVFETFKTLLRRPWLLLYFVPLFVVALFPLGHIPDQISVEGLMYSLIRVLVHIVCSVFLIKRILYSVHNSFQRSDLVLAIKSLCLIPLFFVSVAAVWRLDIGLQMYKNMFSERIWFLKIIAHLLGSTICWVLPMMVLVFFVYAQGNLSNALHNLEKSFFKLYVFLILGYCALNTFLWILMVTTLLMIMAFIPSRPAEPDMLQALVTTFTYVLPQILVTLGCLPTLGTTEGMGN